MSASSRLVELGLRVQAPFHLVEEIEVLFNLPFLNFTPHGDVVFARVAIIVKPSAALRGVVVTALDFANLGQILALELVLIGEVLVFALEVVHVDVLLGRVVAVALAVKAQVAEVDVDTEGFKLVLRAQLDLNLRLLGDQPLFLSVHKAFGHQIHPNFFLLCEPLAHILWSQLIVGRHVVDVPEVILGELADTHSIAEAM